MRIRLTRFWLLCALTLTLLSAAAVVSADNNVDATKYDGRLNMADWVDNHAVYCIDQNGNPTSDGWSNGGIRVLDGSGQVVFFASAAEIEALGVPTENTLIHTEGGLSLYRQSDGGFSLNGIDEWGSPYSFVFNDCLPINAIAFTHASIPHALPVQDPEPPCFVPSAQGLPDVPFC